MPAGEHESTATVRCTHLEIAQVPRTCAVLLAKPYWIWGAEMGANEHGVVIGNEAVVTKVPYEPGPGLIGMDLLRLGLQRHHDRELLRPRVERSRVARDRDVLVPQLRGLRLRPLLLRPALHPIERRATPSVPHDGPPRRRTRKVDVASAIALLRDHGEQSAEDLHRATLSDYASLLGLYRSEQRELESRFRGEAAGSCSPQARSACTIAAFAQTAEAEQNWLRAVKSRLPQPPQRGLFRSRLEALWPRRPTAERTRLTPACSYDPGPDKCRSTSVRRGAAASDGTRARIIPMATAGSGPGRVRDPPCGRRAPRSGPRRPASSPPSPPERAPAVASAR